MRLRRHNLLPFAAALVWLSPLAAQPVPLGDTFEVSSAGPAYVTPGRVLADGHGGFVALWWQRNEPGGVWARAFDAGSNPLNAAQRVDVQSTPEFLGADVALASQGELLVVWAERDLSSTSRGGGGFGSTGR